MISRITYRFKILRYWIVGIGNAMDDVVGKEWAGIAKSPLIFKERVRERLTIYYIVQRSLHWSRDDVVGRGSATINQLNKSPVKHIIGEYIPPPAPSERGI